MCILCECKEKKDYSTLKSLEIIWCAKCPNIISTAEMDIAELKYLWCSDCPNLVRIPNIVGLKHLFCFNCPSLINIPDTDKLVSCYYNNCPWINHEQNLDYKDNLRKLLLLQRFCKKNFRYFVFNRWVKSQEFIEWFYSPENVGGRKHKKIMERNYA